MGSAAVNISMNVIFPSCGGLLTVIEKPNDTVDSLYGADRNLITYACAVDESVEAIMEKQVSITSSRVRRTNPERLAGIYPGIGSPRHGVIVGHIEDSR